MRDRGVLRVGADVRMGLIVLGIVFNLALCFLALEDETSTGESTGGETR